jgi:hypothetical protein
MGLFQILKRKHNYTLANKTLEMVYTLLIYLLHHQSKIIEIQSNFNSDLIIAANHLQRNDNFVIEIAQEKVQALTNEFKQDYTLMAEHLKIMNKRMVLLNPVIYFD